jgi:hypothetical protein
MSSKNYTVYIAGSKIDLTAETPEEAAVRSMKAKGWTSVRSIGIIGDDVHFEYLNCEIVDSTLRYSETSPLPLPDDRNRPWLRKI